jgi:esterase/lipase
VADRWQRCVRGFRNGRSTIPAPLLVIENSADDAVPQPHSKMLHDAALSTDKTFHVVKGATHYYAGQPALLAEAISLIFDWLSERRMGVH